MPDPSCEILVVGIIQRFDNRYLITRARDGAADTAWTFPTGAVSSGESPEEAMRRVAETLLGMRIEIAIGQPPVEAIVAGKRSILRYYLCGLLEEWSGFSTIDLVRWATRSELRSLPFIAYQREVVAWLQEQPG